MKKAAILFKHCLTLALCSLCLLAEAGTDSFGGSTPSGCGVTMSCTGGGGVFPSTGGGGPGNPGGGGSGGGEPGTCTGTAGAPCSAAGNPINVLTGNKYQREVDMAPLPGVLGLEIVRHYNSDHSHANQAPGIFGRGWRLSYDTSLHVIGNTVQIVDADGSRHVFYRSSPEATTARPLDPAFGSVTLRSTRAGNDYTWNRPNGRSESFDHNGRLVQIAVTSGEFLSIQRDPAGQIAKVTDPQGRSLVFSYVDGRLPDRFHGVAHIDSPVGRYSYAYASLPEKGVPAKVSLASVPTLANLVSVVLPTHYNAEQKQHAYANRGVTSSAVTRSYHYEDAAHPTLLTGISVTGSGSDGQPMSQRIVTWAYDAQGRATLSVKGALRAQGRGNEQVNVRYAAPGLSVLTNSLGQETTYRYTPIAGEYRLLEIRGPGCVTCEPSNRRYSYDPLGRRISSTLLNAEGQPLATQYNSFDAQGRLLRIAVATYLRGKAQPAKEKLRLEYTTSPAGSTLPSAVIRPSVVAGREYRRSFTYNAAGQVLTISESGYSPLDENGRPVSAGIAIKRTTTYTYQNINGRSLLVQTDGPLANGPAADPGDSDITRYTWNAHGDRITAITEPGNRATHLEHDATTGRLLARTDATGRQTRWRFDLAYLARPTERTQGGQYIAYTYDALGRLVRIGDSEQRAAILGYDDANRLTSSSDAQGYRQQTSFDTEGKPMVIGLFEPDREGVLRASYAHYDAANRLDRRIHPDGRIDTWQYGANGELLEHVDGDAVRHIVRSNADHTLRLNLDLAPDERMRVALTATAAPTPGMDDFGRQVVLALPDHGVKRAIYDAANRLLTMIEAPGTPQETRTTYRYNLAGQVVERTTLEADKPTVQTVTYRYENNRLTEVKDPTQTTRYQYDAEGRLVQTTVSLDQYSFSTATRYDALGQAQTQTLADGRVMWIERNAQATPVAMKLYRPWAATTRAWIEDILPAWMSGLTRLLPATPVVSDIAFHPFNGIAGYTQGNGLSTHKQFDIAGRVAALSVKTDGKVLTDQRFGYAAGPRLMRIEDLLDSARPQKTTFRYTGFGALKRTLWDSPMPRQALSALNGLVSKAATAVSPSSFAGEGWGISSDLADVVCPPGRMASCFIRGGRSLVSQPSASRDALGRITQDQRYRYTYTPQGQLTEVRDLQDTLIASYRYNSLKQRVAKSVNGITTYYLWQNQRVVAEANSAGKITAQYLYLTEGNKAIPIAKLESADNPDNTIRSNRILYIHADQRGAPQLMTDEAQHLVWQADTNPWGAPIIRTAANDARFVNSATLNLRLPGQYYDAETGLHDNVCRTYNPNTGRYLQPDPLGYPDGPDAYLYASGDPVNKIDPLGLYEADIHYYMTFFLALTAGIDYEAARIMALASQFVDNNPMTMPVDPTGPLSTILSVFKNHQQLLLYHFVLSDSADPDASSFGKTLDAYDNDTVNSVVGNYSPQLQNLYNAINNPKTVYVYTRYQFLGEFMHSFADTFSHRTRCNIPFDALTFGAGLGHGTSGSNPDYTYDTMGGADPNDPIIRYNNWAVRPERTLAAETAMYGVLKQFGSNAIAFSELEETLKEFNQTPEHGDTPDVLTKKLTLLQNKLNEFIDAGKLTLVDKNGDSVTKIDFSDPKAQQYDEGIAKKNRDTQLSGLKEDDYPGVCLPGGTRCVSF